MIRKYVVIKSANDEMVELVANRIFDDKTHADNVCKDQRDQLVEESLRNNPTAAEALNSYEVAFRAAKSFIKVYELVAVDL